MLHGMKGLHMSFKKFSSAQSDSGKASPVDKLKDASGPELLTAQPDKTPIDVSPAKKIVTIGTEED